MLILLGSPNNAEIDAICRALARRDAPYLLIDFSSPASLVIKLDSETGDASVFYQDIEIPPKSIIWWGAKQVVPRFGDTDDWANAYITMVHWKAAIDNLMRVVDATVLFDHVKFAKLSSKLWQLQQARKLGFEIGNSLVSNDITEIKRWRAEHGPLVSKALGDATFPTISANGVRAESLRTNRVADAILENSESEQSFPVLVQRNILKRYEYRVVVINESIIAFRIDPAQHEIMKIDYRMGGFLVDYQLVELPPALKVRILDLHKHFDLFSGSYDFIEDIEGRIVFLEVNMAGVWGHLDYISKGEISRNIADRLISLEATSSEQRA